MYVRRQFDRCLSRLALRRPKLGDRVRTLPAIGSHALTRAQDNFPVESGLLPLASGSPARDRGPHSSVVEAGAVSAREGDCMFVRVGIFHGAPEHLDDDAIRHAREQMLLRLQQQPGFAGQHILADRQTGKTLAFSFWDTEAALRVWEQIRGPIVATTRRPLAGPSRKVAAMR